MDSFKMARVILEGMRAYFGAAQSSNGEVEEFSGINYGLQHAEFTVTLNRAEFCGDSAAWIHATSVVSR